MTIYEAKARKTATQDVNELPCLCSWRRPAFRKVTAEAWIIELPRDADAEKVTGQAPEHTSRVWQTTLTADTAVDALLLPATALPRLLEEFPQVPSTDVASSQTLPMDANMFTCWPCRQRWTSGRH